ncbi:MAG: (d)CMP kinase [bacterium]|jgi:cytidylate kinase
MKNDTIAIDGPAGAGKSTVARLLARRLGFLYVDTGAMYRAAALVVERNAVAFTAEDEITALIRSARIEFVNGEGDTQYLYLNGEDVTEAIRTPGVASLASQVSAIPGVRRALVALQQQLAVSGGVVMEGRDIGTVVAPDAEIKIFLTATPEERANRRHAELAARGNDVSLESVRADQDERDERDATRQVAPLVAASDAIILYSDGQTPEEIVEDIVAMTEARRREA